MLKLLLDCAIPMMEKMTSRIFQEVVHVLAEQLKGKDIPQIQRSAGSAPDLEWCDLIVHKMEDL